MLFFRRSQSTKKDMLGGHAEQDVEGIAGIAFRIRDLCNVRSSGCCA